MHFTSIIRIFVKIQKQKTMKKYKVNSAFVLSACYLCFIFGLAIADIGTAKECEGVYTMWDMISVIIFLIIIYVLGLQSKITKQ